MMTVVLLLLLINDSVSDEGDSGSSTGDGDGVRDCGDNDSTAKWMWYKLATELVAALTSMLVMGSELRPIVVTAVVMGSMTVVMVAVQQDG